MKEVMYKVPGGKLLRVKVRVRNEKIAAVIICGDFFVYPEEGIGVIEASLRGVMKGEINERIRKIVEENKIEFVGMAIEDVANTIERCFEE